MPFASLWAYVFSRSVIVYLMCWIISEFIHFFPSASWADEWNILHYQNNLLLLQYTSRGIILLKGMWLLYSLLCTYSEKKLQWSDSTISTEFQNVPTNPSLYSHSSWHSSYTFKSFPSQDIPVWSPPSSNQQQTLQDWSQKLHTSFITYLWRFKITAGSPWPSSCNWQEAAQPSSGSRGEMIRKVGKWFQGGHRDSKGQSPAYVGFMVSCREPSLPWGWYHRQFGTCTQFGMGCEGNSWPLYRAGGSEGVKT